MYLLKLAPLRVEIIVIHALGWDVEGSASVVPKCILVDIDRENSICIYFLYSRSIECPSFNFFECTWQLYFF